jgi:hypothetical protein
MAAADEAAELEPDFDSALGATAAGAALDWATATTQAEP